MDAAAQTEGPPAPAVRTTLGHLCLIVAVTGSVYFANLGGSKLWDRDEPRNAGLRAGNAALCRLGDALFQRPIANPQARC